jgi:nucleoside-diphosphate-sugar epimerase
MKILFTGDSGSIGTHVVHRLLARGHQVLNLSTQPPHESAHKEFWQKTDMLDASAVRAAFQFFSPELVLHLAARTEMDEKTTAETGFRANTEGTHNILAAVQSTPSIRRAVICSSQFVCGPRRLPEHDEDYFPATIYGQSKVITEQETRRANLACEWVIVRPTNIWGPWHPRYPQEFWRIAAKGLYVHPGGKSTAKPSMSATHPATFTTGLTPSAAHSTANPPAKCHALYSAPPDSPETSSPPSPENPFTSLLPASAAW